jgi:hypothetical protein
MRWLTAALCVSMLATPIFAQPPASPFRELVTDGITVFSPTEIRWTLQLEDGSPLPDTTDELAAKLHRRYGREGYTKAAVAVSFQEQTGRLSITANEGRIDAVAFEGLEQSLAEELRDAFAVRPGDLYNTRQISRALETLLKPARGAIRLRYVSRAEPGTVFHDSAELQRKTESSPFDLLDRDGRRTLVISLRRVSKDLNTTVGTEAREDWYNPVDGLNLAVGVGGAIFDHRKFDHTFLQAYVSYKFAREKFGYAFGFERQIAGDADSRRLLLNAEVHDVTASDDAWRLSVTEQSLVSLTFKNSFRDYFNERGYQVGLAFQPNPVNELRASWHADRHEPLTNEAEYSVFRDDATFRSNRAAADGRLRALVFGYTLDTRGLVEESGRASLRRHTGPALFGTFGGTLPGMRLEWTSEIGRPAFGSDFDFTRHIANARVYLPLSPAQRLNGRLLIGASTGTLPAQRLFALGGIGTVHGYSFKEVAGERMVLANAEYNLGSHRSAHVIGFLDVGRVYRPVTGIATSSGEWLTGLGVGLGIGDLRIDFGWRADDIPRSLQIIARFGPTF